VAERKFRDGKREIPDYMDDLMRGIETERLTYEESIVAMNRAMVGQHINRAMDRLTAGHMSLHAERRR
jgi:hypothetical protein